MKNLVLYFDDRQQAESFAGSLAFQISYDISDNPNLGKVTFNELSECKLQTLVLDYGAFKQTQGVINAAKFNKSLTTN